MAAPAARGGAAAVVPLALALVAACLFSAAAQTTATIPPGTYTTLTVAKGTTRYLGAGTYSFSKLVVAGKLVCGSPTAMPDISLSAVRIEVSGVFECGTKARPYTGKVTITMTGSGAEGTKVIDVTGKIYLHGRRRTAWTSLTTTVMPGDTVFTTAAAVDWLPGDKLVVSSTDFDYKNAEEVTVVSVEGGNRVTVEPAFDVAHWGELQTFTTPKGKAMTLDERAQVALLERNIVVQGDAASLGGNGAIVTIRNGGNGYSQDVKFDRVGQRGRLGTYPWHWHMLDNRKGNYFVNNVVTRSTNRCVTIHGTDNVLVERNVCYDHIGHGFFIEDGCEEGNMLKYNLGLLTKKPASLRAGAIDTDTTHLSTFWITNPNNHFIGNVAAGSEFAGYWFMLPLTPTRECFKHPTKRTLQPNRRPLGTFDDNMAHSNNVGVGIEGGIVNSDRAPTSGSATFWDPPTFPRMDNLTIYKNTNGQRSLWVTMFKTIYFTNARLADNGGSTLFSGAQIVQDGLFVGESANTLTNQRKSVTFGFGLYDGPGGLVDTHFAGYPMWYQYPLPVTGAGIKNWNFFLKGVTFDPDTVLNRLTLRGNLSTAETFSQGIIDVSGSLTGSPNTVIMMPLDSQGVRPPSRQSKDFNVISEECTFSTPLQTYVCPGTMQWATLVIDHRFKGEGHVVDVTRSDGPTASVDNHIRPHYAFNTIINRGITYTIRYRDRNSLLFSGTTPRDFQIILSNLQARQGVSITLANLPQGPWKWSATECYTHRVLVKPQASGKLTIKLTARPMEGWPAGQWPNQRTGQVRVRVCPSERCPC